MNAAPPAPASARDAGRNYFLLALLAISAALRVALALRGGQYFFGDELRYSRGALIYLGILQHNAAQIAAGAGSPEHPGFILLTTALAPLQHLLAALTGHGDWHNVANFYASAPEGAMLLGLFSVLNLWLVHRIARAAGGSRREADGAALLAACSAGLFYFSRHLLPYDAALSAGLASLLCAFRARTWRGHFLAGVFAGACYALYNGYWFMVPILALACVLALTSRAVARLRALLAWSAGALVAAIGAMIPGALAQGPGYWTQMAHFSRTVRQGVYAEGWSLPWEYGWHADHLVGALVLALAAAAIFLARRDAEARRRIARWWWLVAAAYLLLVVASVGFEKFVVYGRTVRPLIPLLCLPAGFALARVVDARRWARPLVLAGLVAAAAFDFLPHYALAFPADVRERVWREAGVPKLALSFSGPLLGAPNPPVQRPDLALVNTEALFPLRDFVGEPAGETIFSVAHPSSLAAYQYEGYTPRERRLLRGHDVSIKLIRLAHPADVPDSPPPAQLMQPSDVPDGRDRGRR
ncbi:MAG TPA: hypothetical protein VHD62_11595 [Opitutaceae bacterium]|nr:hypothetical protein [Opitutaceae bacterium]